MKAGNTKYYINVFGHGVHDDLKLTFSCKFYFISLSMFFVCHNFVIFELPPRLIPLFSTFWGYSNCVSVRIS